MRKQQGTTGVPLNLFISYTHEDEPLRRQLETHLSLLQRQGLVASWHDRQILAGNDWAQEIDQHLESASIILLLISPDFLASDYCYEIEMEHALERHKRGEARVIPVILRPCDWRTSQFARLQCLPRNIQPVTTWTNQDEALAAIAQELRQIITTQHFAGPLLSGVQKQNRVRLLKRVRTTWIKGLLENSLHQAAWIDLHLQEHQDALDNPWHLAYQEFDSVPRPLPTGTSISQVYDEAEGELLILGEPGSGKTTLLLHLARTLLDRAEVDMRHPLPVLFNLSSWAQRRLPLDQWLVSELQEKYRVHPSISRPWVEHHELLLLLDGLDEVAVEARVACVQAITAYHQDQQNQATSSLAICCRSHEYQELAFHLPLNQAISILPLTDQQVDTYLSRVGKEADGLRYLLAVESEFAALVHTPLMLSVATLAFWEKRVVNFPSPNNFPSQNNFPTYVSQERLYQIVFQSYVERMLNRRGQLQLWKQEQFLHWLGTLAKHMKQEQQTIFPLENLQPSWLSNKERFLFQWGVGIFTGLGGALIVGLVVGIVGMLVTAFTHAWPVPPLVIGLMYGVASALVSGLVSGVVAGLEKRIRPAEKLIWLWKGWQKFIVGLIKGFIGGFLGTGWLFFGVAVLGYTVYPLSERLIFGLHDGLLQGTFIGLFTGFLGGLLTSMSSGLLTERVQLIPNEGIWRSAKNGLFVGLFGGFALGLISWLVSPMIFTTSRLRERFLLALFIWLIGWLIIGLLAGFRAFLQHFFLRIILRCKNELPWNLIPFLDEGAKLLLLRKVGGSYIFMHRLLLEYFAALETPLAEKVSTGSALLQKPDEKEEFSN